MACRVDENNVARWHNDHHSHPIRIRTTRLRCGTVTAGAFKHTYVASESRQVAVVMKLVVCVVCVEFGV